MAACAPRLHLQLLPACKLHITHLHAEETHAFMPCTCAASVDQLAHKWDSKLAVLERLQVGQACCTAAAAAAHCLLATWMLQLG